MEPFLRVILGGVGLIAVLLGMRHAARLLTRERLAQPGDFQEAPRRADEQSGLSAWLLRAGLRGPNAIRRFLIALGLCVVLGACVGLLLSHLDAGQMLALWTADVPGGFGDVFVPMLMASPWLAFVFVACMPWLWVRRARRRRVESIERDLPVVLELLATLGEAGFGLDAGLRRVLEVQDARRPLAQELRHFQQDALAGIPRTTALRRLSSRIELTSVSILVSALLQAEQVGAALAETLRSQAQDLWSRRREDALTRAQALPAKLAFPLVLCFLPALFVITLGPILVEFVQLAESVSGRAT
ncbi:MAG: membrane protein [Planctomycetota bacterium]|nr:MAG: membrane protein [Planctomycetota bacterium]